MVEKMKLLHITGPKYDIDRVMEQYLSRYEIHFENAASGFGISGHVRPFAETNIYKDACTKAQALWEHLKDEPGGAADYAMPVKMEPAEAEKVVEAAYRLTDEIVKRQEEMRKERMENQSLMDQIAPFRRLDYEFKKFWNFSLSHSVLEESQESIIRNSNAISMIPIMYYFMNVTVTRHMCGAAILCQESTQRSRCGVSVVSF